tara:strand:- start:2317 stop:2532 length:216 start_codon:yes stop_codon:yes gene_type:complete
VGRNLSVNFMDYSMQALERAEEITIERGYNSIGYITIDRLDEIFSTLNEDNIDEHVDMIVEEARLLYEQSL